MSPLVEIVELGTTGVAAAVAAFHLGLYPVELQMMVFFAAVLAGQVIAEMLARMAPARKSEPLE
jgi:hypothetical protein